MKKGVSILLLAAVAAGAWYFTRADHDAAEAIDTSRVLPGSEAKELVFVAQPDFATGLYDPCGVTQLADGRVLVTVAGKVLAFAAQ